MTSNQEPMDDRELSGLLRQWITDTAPSELETRVFGAARRVRSRRLAATSAAALLGIAGAIAGGWWSLRQPPNLTAPQLAMAPPAQARIAVARPSVSLPTQSSPAPEIRPHSRADISSGPDRAPAFASKPAPEPEEQLSGNAKSGALPAGVYQVGNGVTAPKLLKRTEPEYSDEARMARLDGTAVLVVVISEGGTARDVRVTRSLGLGLDENAVAMVSNSWRFQPGTKAGDPVAVPATIEVRFRMENSLPWHLARAVFTPPEGASRPVLLEAPYPADAGNPSLDTVRIGFDVDDNGIPINFRALASGNPNLESEAIGIVSGWRFRPGTSNGKPVAVPAIFDFAHVKATGPQNQSGVINVGAAIASSNLIGGPAPIYPREAKAARIQGTVTLQVRIGKDGHVIEAIVLSGPPLLSDAAVEAVKQWLYRPTLLNGQPVEISTQVDVNFTLSN